MNTLDNDLISRKALLEALEEYQNKISWLNPANDYLDNVYDLITDAPTVEADSGEAILYAIQGYKEALKLHNGATLCTEKQDGLHTLPLFTSPPKREWINLDPFEVDALINLPLKDDIELAQLVRKIQARLKELNHG